MNMEKIKNQSDLVKKIEDFREKSGADLSSGEDLRLGLMNLISIEEHLYFTAMKTGKKTYLDMLSTVREMRKNLLKEIVKEPEGEVWCLSKHLLASSMRLIETGTKYMGKDEKKANYLFKSAFELYSLFWGPNLGIVKTSEASEEFKEEIKGDGWKTNISSVIKKIVDCCKE